MRGIVILLVFASIQAWTSDFAWESNRSNGSIANKSLITLGVFAALCTEAVGQTAKNDCPMPPYTFTNNETIGWAWWQIATGGFAIISVVSSFIAPWYYWRKVQKDIAKSLQEQIDVLKRENSRMQSNEDYCYKLARSLSQRLK